MWLPILFVLSKRYGGQQDSNYTASAAYTLITCDFGGVDQDRGLETSSVVAWYDGDLVAKAFKAYYVRPAGKYLDMSSASWRLATGLQHATVTWDLAAGPDRFEERSRYNFLSSNGHPSRGSAAEEGPTTMILKRLVQTSKSFSQMALLSAPFCGPCRMVAALLYTQTHPLAAYLG